MMSLLAFAFTAVCAGVPSASPVALRCVCANASSVRARVPLLVGWRGVPHSYAIVAEGLVSGLRAAGVVPSWVDAPSYKSSWEREGEGAAAGLLPLPHARRYFRHTEQGVIMPPGMCTALGPGACVRFDDEVGGGEEPCPALILRSYSPLDTAAHPCKGEPYRVLVFGTTEFGGADPHGAYQSPLHMGGRSRAWRAPWEGLHGSVTLATPSEWSAAGFVASGVRKSSIRVVPHGVDTSLFHPPSADDADARPRAGRCLAVAHVGHMLWTKGADIAIQAVLSAAASLLPPLASSPASLPPCISLALKGLNSLYASEGVMPGHVEKARVALPRGYGPGRTGGLVGGSVAVEALESAGVLSITYDGGDLPRAAVPRLYTRAHLLLAPYRAEGFNLPVLEALACGTPVLVTAGGATDGFTHPVVALYAAGRTVRGVAGKGAGVPLELSRHIEANVSHVAALLASLAVQQAEEAGLAPFVCDPAMRVPGEEDEEGVRMKRQHTPLPLPPRWLAHARCAAAGWVGARGLSWSSIVKRHVLPLLSPASMGEGSWEL
jgi:hypothetical protein